MNCSVSSNFMSISLQKNAAMFVTCSLVESCKYVVSEALNILFLCRFIYNLYIVIFHVNIEEA